MKYSIENEELRKSTKLAEIVKRYILKKMPLVRQDIEEEMDSDAEIESKDQQIQHLKDMLRIQRDTNQSLRNQIKALKARKAG